MPVRKVSVLSEKQSNRAMRATLTVTLVIIVSKLCGFVRDMVLANYFGTTVASDAYNSAYSLFYLPILLFNSCITSTLVPQYMRVRDERNLHQANRFASNVLNVFSLFALVVSALMYLLAGPLVNLIYSGFGPEKAALTTELTRVMMPSLIFFVASIVLTSILNATEHYNAAQLTGFPLSLALILAMVLFADRCGIHAVAWGVFVAGVLQVVVLLPALRKCFHYRPVLNMRDARLRRLLVLAVPAVLSMAVNELNHMVDRWLASSLTDGTLAAMSYAFRLITFVTGILIVPITTVMFSRMSRFVAQRNAKALRTSVSESLQVIAIVVLPITVIACVMSTDVIRFAYGRGAFGEESVAMTASIFVFYMIGVLFFGARDFLNRAFHALSDTKTPMRFACVSMVLNVTLNLLLKPVMGANGLALATSISAAVGATLLLISLKKRMKRLPMREMATEMIKILIASAVCGVVCLGMRYGLPGTLGTLHVFLRLCAATIVSALAYVGVLMALRVRQVSTVLQILKRR